MIASRPIGHRQVFTLAWPILVSMLSYTAMTIADSLFVAQLGTSELAALGLAATGLHLVTAFPNGLLGGARVQIAQAYGAEDLPRARGFAFQALFVAVLSGAAVLSLLPLVSGFAHALASGPLAEHTVAYLWVRLLGAPLIFLVFALQAWFQGIGDTRTPMVGTLIANAANVALDPILIFGWGGVPALGVAGAAWATVVAYGVQVAVLLVPFAKLFASRVGPDRALLREVWHTGLPMGTNFALDVASYLVFSGLLAAVGDAHLAAHVIVVRILMVSFLPGHAIGQATGVLVGQALGARRPAGAREAWTAGATQAVGLMLVMGFVFLLLPGPIVQFFGADAEVASIAVDVLRLAALVQAFDAAAMVGFGALNGAGDTRFTMAAGLAATWLVKIPISIIGVQVLAWGAMGAWLGIATEIVLVAVLALVRVRGSAWLGHAARRAARLQPAT